MKKRFVSSSSIEALGYDQDTQSLKVWFATGKVYVYHNVPEEEFKNLLDASSIGAYFNHNIKGGYSYEKLK